MVSDWVYSIAGLIVFALMHSVVASHGVKSHLQRLWPDIMPFYRFFYNLLSIIYLILWYIFIPPPSYMIYKVPFPYAYPLLLIEILNLIAIYKAAQQFGSARFFGIPQILTYFRTGIRPEYFDEMRRGELVTRGIYRWVRHPLYTFSILLLMASPVMNTRLLTILIFGALYFYIGSIFEERKLVDRFGETYKKYQQEVPRLIPWKIPK